MLGQGNVDMRIEIVLAALEGPLEALRLRTAKRLVSRVIAAMCQSERKRSNAAATPPERSRLTRHSGERGGMLPHPPRRLG